MVKRPKNAYERELQHVKNIVQDIGTHLHRELEWAMQALIKHDSGKAFEVLELDREVDSMEGDLEFKVLDLISLQQPTTTDLRLLAAALRVGRELERFGDYAVNIAEAANYLAATGEYFKPLQDIPRMAEMVKEMLSVSLQAYAAEDMELAKKVLEMDKPVDDLFKFLHDELIDYMKKGARYVEQGSYFLLVTRYLERMGDHAVNVAQMANFIVTGAKIPKRHELPNTK